jgi:hypothetical protein
MRVTGVHVLGVLAQRYPGGKSSFESHVDTFLSSKYGTQAQVGAMFLSEWAYAKARNLPSGEEVLALPQTLQDRLDAHLQTLDQPGFEYAESANLTAKWRQELEGLLQLYQQVMYMYVFSVRVCMRVVSVRVSPVHMYTRTH